MGDPVPPDCVHDVVVVDSSTLSFTTFRGLKRSVIDLPQLVPFPTLFEFDVNAQCLENHLFLP